MGAHVDPGTQQRGHAAVHIVDALGRARRIVAGYPAVSAGRRRVVVLGLYLVSVVPDAIGVDPLPDARAGVVAGLPHGPAAVSLHVVTEDGRRQVRGDEERIVAPRRVHRIARLVPHDVDRRDPVLDTGSRRLAGDLRPHLTGLGVDHLEGYGEGTTETGRGVVEACIGDTRLVENRRLDDVGSGRVLGIAQSGGARNRGPDDVDECEGHLGRLAGIDLHADQGVGREALVVHRHIPGTGLDVALVGPVGRREHPASGTQDGDGGVFDRRTAGRRVGHLALQRAQVRRQDRQEGDRAAVLHRSGPGRIVVRVGVEQTVAVIVVLQPHREVP